LRWMFALLVFAALALSLAQAMASVTPL